ncbi:ParB N-terminal domain-containing protein [Actinocorallia lasiicapitis]
MTVLRSSDSPRLEGEDHTHVELLRDNLLHSPPIVVNRRTMRVIDGMHRVSAARLQGQELIEAVFVDVADHDAFLLSVKANITHGLPLSLSDREAAAHRVLAWYPAWSDRAIAGACGLAPKTVGAIRARSTGDGTQSNVRVGLDGRVRPISTIDARRRAGEILTTRPEASLREVARESGLSLGTVHDVRERLRQGRDPVPDGQMARQPRPRGRRTRGAIVWKAVRDRLLKDPTVKYAEAGKELLRWFDTRSVDPGEWRRLLDSVPGHWMEAMARVAAANADEWQEFARELQRRGAELTDPR